MLNYSFCWDLNLYFPKLLPGSVVLAGNVESCCWNTEGVWLPGNAVPWSITSTDLMTRYNIEFSHSSQIWQRKCHCASVGSSCPKSLNYGKETVSSSKSLCVSWAKFQRVCLIPTSARWGMLTHVLPSLLSWWGYCPQESRSLSKVHGAGKVGITQ